MYSSHQSATALNFKELLQIEINYTPTPREIPQASRFYLNFMTPGIVSTWLLRAVLDWRGTNEIESVGSSP